MGVTPGYQQSDEHVRKRMASKRRTIAVKPKPFDKEWLASKYIGEKLDCVQIGVIAGRDAKTIWSWLRYYGIPTRPRGGHNRKESTPQSPRIEKSPLTERELIDMYITQEMACREIAEKTGHSKSVIFRAVTRFGIPTRDNRYYRLKDGRKPYLKNGVHHLKGKPPSEHPNWKGGLTPERQSFYASAEWKESCKAVWHRADARCERCGIHHNEAATRGTFHIHHIITFMVRELRAKVSNLVLLCKKCHKFVHSKQNTYREFIGEKNARA